MIHLEGVSVTYDNGTRGLESVTTHIAKGEFVYLVVLAPLKLQTQLLGALGFTVLSQQVVPASVGPLAQLYGAVDVVRLERRLPETIEHLLAVARLHRSFLKLDSVTASHNG